MLLRDHFLDYLGIEFPGIIRMAGWFHRQDFAMQLGRYTRSHCEDGPCLRDACNAGSLLICRQQG